MGYIFIAFTILFTVYGQLILKWRVSNAGALPASPAAQAEFIGRLLLDPWVLSGLAAAFVASLFWMGVVSKLDLSKAYPFMAINFVLVGVAAIWLFGEAFSMPKAIGTGLVVAGLIVMTRA